MVSKATSWLLYNFENSRTNACIQAIGSETYDSLINIPFFVKYCVIFLLQMIYILKKKNHSDPVQVNSFSGVSACHLLFCF